MEHNLTFDIENKRLNIRVAAFITCDEKVLLSKNPKDDYLSLPGGRVQLGESTEEAIKREIKEELGIHIKNAKLTVISENFYIHKDLNIHEFLFIYKYNIDNNLGKKLENSRILDKPKSILNWYKFEELKKLEYRPQCLIDIPNFTELTHLCNK